MSKVIVINAEHGGADTGNNGKEINEKDYTLKISDYIGDELKKEGVKTYIVRNGDDDMTISERIDMIEEETPNSKDTVIITNSIGNTYGGAEIIYSLDDKSNLANFIANELESIGVKVNKYYQRRLPSDTTKDYHEIIRMTGDRESIIIEYGDLLYDEDFIKNNWQELGQAVVNALNKYLGFVDVYYTVKSGDNLYSIAQKFNTSVSELKEINNLGTNSLSIGQQLLIPEKDAAGKNYYIVVSGDNLYSIAQKNNTTVSELMKLNNLTSANLSAGQRLRIPEAVSSNDKNYYIVKIGDTLYGIANKYKVSVNELKILNNLSNNILSIGQKIIIPNSNKIYAVKKGDSLYSIAKANGMTVDELIDLNDLDSTLLSIGQQLKISQ